MDDANAMTDEQLKKFIEQINGGRGDGSPASNSFDHWQCETCQTDAMEREPMFAHLREVHDIDAENTSASMNMTMHLDGRDWYQTNYAISLLDGRVNLSRFIRNERNADAMMRWA